MILLSCLQLYFLFSPPVAAAAMEIRQFLAVLNSCHLSSTAVRTTYYTEVGDKKLRTDPPPDTVQQRYEI